MGTAEIIAIAIGVGGVLAGIFLATIAIIWQIRSQSDRVDALGERISGEIRELRAEIRDVRADMKSQGGEITEARLEQARLEGANQILRRQSHTHPPHNPPIDQEAAAD